MSHNIRAIRAFFVREIRAAVINRFIHVFYGAVLLAGIAPLFADTTAQSADVAPYFLIQVVLYVIPLFALLIGVGSAQCDLEERGFLFAQPAGRAASVLGKFLALWLLLAMAALLLVLPSAFGETALRPLCYVGFHAMGAAGVFLAIGLATGFGTTDRVKAHLAALCIWFIFLAGFDLVALTGAQFPALQKWPGFWTSLLMINPLDSLRVGALFSVDHVPFDVASAPPLARWWLSHLGGWFAAVAAGWIAASLCWSGFRLHRADA